MEIDEALRRLEDGDLYDYKGYVSEIGQVALDTLEGVSLMVDSQKEVAQWLVRDGYPHRIYCSLCKQTFCDERWEVWKDGSLPRAYCPSCGAKMLFPLFKIKEES